MSTRLSREDWRFGAYSAGVALEVAFSGAEATSCQLLSAACSRSHMISSGGQRMLLVCIKRALDGESSGRVECVSVTSCLE